MNKLREKIANQKVIVFGCGSLSGNPCLISEKMSERSVEHLEQITDDFSVKFGKWLVKNYMSNTPMEDQQKYFKNNIYGN